MNNAGIDNPIIENSFVRLEIREGILFVTYKKGITLTIDKAKELIEIRKQFTANKPYPILIKDEGIITGDKATRDYLSNKGTEGLTAGAFVLKSIYSTLLFNFYLKITNPKIPSLTFTDEKKAIEWLSQYKVK